MRACETPASDSLTVNKTMERTCMICGSERFWVATDLLLNLCQMCVVFCIVGNKNQKKWFRSNLSEVNFKAIYLSQPNLAVMEEMRQCAEFLQMHLKETAFNTITVFYSFCSRTKFDVCNSVKPNKEVEKISVYSSARIQACSLICKTTILISSVKALWAWSLLPFFKHIIHRN